MKTIAQAISDFESADGSYANAVSQTANGQTVSDAAQVKADQTKAALTDLKAAQDTSAKSRNDALDVLIAAATAAKTQPGQ